MPNAETPGSVMFLHPFWRRVRFKVLLHHALFLILLGLALGVLGTKLHSHMAAAEAWVAGFGAWSIVVFVGLFVILTSVFVPDTVLALTAGVLFALPQGIAAVCIGGVVSAAAQYALGRHLLKHRIERLLATRPRLAAIQNAVRQQEVRLQLLLRLTPVSPTLSNYVLGAAAVRFGGFLFASIALFPTFALEVYLGYASRHAIRVGAGGEHARLQDVATVGGLLAGVLVVVIMSKVARNALQAATTVAGSAAGLATEPVD